MPHPTTTEHTFSAGFYRHALPLVVAVLVGVIGAGVYFIFFS